MTDSQHNPASPLIILVAGEASGDLLGADLIAGLRRHFPNARFAGVGGPRMAQAGMEIWHPIERLSIMGLVEVLKHLPQLLSLRRDIYRRTLAARPAVFIGIDAPDFNLGLERKIKRSGIRTAHYVSPSVWAWREKRAQKIGRSADLVLCLFPMEPPIYKRYGIDARFVGHPLAQSFPIHPDRKAAREKLELPEDVPILAVMPGSRLAEISLLGRDFLDAVLLLKQQLPQLHIVAPMANAKCRAEFEHLYDESSILAEQKSSIRIIDGNAHTAMIASDAVLLASGTATLEAMLAKRPMVVAYRVSTLTYRIVKALGLIRTDVYALPNILSGQRMVAEFMQDDCKPPALAAALLPALRDRSASPAMLAEFERLHRMLVGDANHDAACAVAELIAP
jgi:lipid-A-disaccharide synthase